MLTACSGQELRSPHAEYWNQQGALKMGRGELVEARSALKLALQHSPHHIAALNNLAELEVQAGHFEEALRLAQKARSLRPDEAQAYYVEALALEALGDEYSAAKYCRKSLELSPSFAAPRYNLVRLLSHAGHHDEAIEQLQQLRLIEPENDSFIEALFEAYFASNRRSAAIALIRSQKREALWLDIASARLGNIEAFHKIAAYSGPWRARDHAWFAYLVQSHDEALSQIHLGEALRLDPSDEIALKVLKNAP